MSTRTVFRHDGQYLQTQTVVTQVSEGWLVSRSVRHGDYTAGTGVSLTFVPDNPHLCKPADFRGYLELEVSEADEQRTMR